MRLNISKLQIAVSKDNLGSKHIRLNDKQRIKLGTLARKIGPKGLAEICTVVSPETLLKWHRLLVARKYDGSKVRKYGRTQISDELRNHIIKIAKSTAAGVIPAYRANLNTWGIKPVLKP